MRRTAWVWVVVLLFAAQGSSVRADEDGACEGPRVVVRYASCPRALAQEALDLLEAALPTYAAQVPYAPPAAQKLVVHLHGTAQTYRNAVTEAGAEWLSGALAATLSGSMECHLVAQPRLEPEYVEKVGGLSELTRFLLFHEATHQIAYRAHPGADRWPDWYGEGMAEHMARLLTKPATGGLPFTIDDKVHRAREAAERGQIPSLEGVLHSLQGDVSVARRPLYYACWGTFYGLLASDPERMKDLHARVRRIGAEAGKEMPSRRAFEEGFADAVRTVYGPLPALEQRWRASLAAAAPEWFEGSRSTQRVGSEWVCAAFPEGTAYAIRAAPAPARPFTVTLEWRLFDLGDRQAEVYLAHEDRANPRFLKVAFRSAGAVTLLAFAEGAWQERYRANAKADAALLSAGAWHRTRIDVDAKTIAVEVDGRRVLEAPVPPGYEPLGRRVGIGAGESVAAFRALEVKPRP
jgi:hypothetical protein